MAFSDSDKLQNSYSQRNTIFLSLIPKGQIYDILGFYDSCGQDLYPRREMKSEYLSGNSEKCISLVNNHSFFYLVLGSDLINFCYDLASFLKGIYM